MSSSSSSSGQPFAVQLNEVVARFTSKLLFLRETRRFHLAGFGIVAVDMETMGDADGAEKRQHWGDGSAAAAAAAAAEPHIGFEYH
ncbi:unnamed protein product [Caenorhabditis bovis]|uniref:Uncharacterized protein n=1 Tax=Caenorhabditis bovis TaxID=2654633 RepID=A0A8S1FB71_9PELO|nr:unnamed protein product [Caenorhabditis bovis]